MAASTAASDEQDRADMQRLVNGHDAALNEIMARHKEALFRYLIRQLHSEEDAADLAQESFVRVYLHRSRFDPRQRFHTWLYTIATNLARDRLKWRARHRQVSLDQPIDEGDTVIRDTIPDNTPLPPDRLDANERARVVRSAIAALPEDLRVPLILAEYESMSHRDIGLVLGCSPKAVETRIYRAKARLREQLGKKQLL